MIIRHATIHDLDALDNIERACFPAAEAAPREALAERLNAYPDGFWVGIIEDKIVSFVNGMATDIPDLRDEMYSDAAMHKPAGAWRMIFGVDTLPEYRGRGYAGELLRRAISDSVAEGREGLVLTCKDALVDWYASFGFVDEGISGSEHGSVRWHQMRLRLGDRLRYCTCSDTACPFHPTRHGRGCTPCIRKYWREREIPSCFFNMVGSAKDVSAYHFEDFARYVLMKQRGLPIETERLYLREMRHEDVDAMLEYLGDKEVMRFYPEALDRQGAIEWVERNIDRYSTLGFGLWAVIERGTETLVGDCGPTMQNINGVIRPEIGWHMRRDRWGQGYATEAGRAVLKWAQANTPFHVFYSYMLKDNLASRRVAEKLGMEYERTYTAKDGTERSVYRTRK